MSLTRKRYENVSLLIFMLLSYVKVVCNEGRYALAQLVEVLRYQLESSGFDSQYNL